MELPTGKLQQPEKLRTRINWVAATNGVIDNGTIKFILVSSPRGTCFYWLFKL